MSFQLAEWLVHEPKRAVSRLHPRFKLALCLCALFLFWLLILDTPALEPERPRRRRFKLHPHSSLPGGNWQGFRQIFAFGDSWSTTRFNVAGEQPSRQNPFGNPQIPENGITSPPNWLHFLTSTYNASFIQAYIIAQGAATVDRDVVAPHELLKWTHTFDEQIEQIFKPNYARQSSLVTWDPNNTLFATWFGVVDVAMLVDRKTANADVVNGKTLESYGKCIRKLYDIGARHFLILTVPPMYISPYARERGHDPKMERSLILDFNERLYTLRKDFIEERKDATVYMFDVHGLLTDVMQNPESITGTENLRNTTENCWKYNPDAYQEPHKWDWYEAECGVPFDQYFWANPLHPTHAAHNATAASIVSDCMGPNRKGYCS